VSKKVMHQRNNGGRDSVGMVIKRAKVCETCRFSGKDGDAMGADGVPKLQVTERNDTWPKIRRKYIS